MYVPNIPDLDDIQKSGIFTFALKVCNWGQTYTIDICCKLKADQIDGSDRKIFLPGEKTGTDVMGRSLSLERGINANARTHAMSQSYLSIITHFVRFIKQKMSRGPGKACSEQKPGSRQAIGEHAT